MPPTGYLAQNPGMCLDWESNQRPFGSQVHAQSTEPHQPDLVYFFLEREKERKRNIDVSEKYRLVASHMHSNQGPNPQAMHMP